MIRPSYPLPRIIFAASRASTKGVHFNLLPPSASGRPGRGRNAGRLRKAGRAGRVAPLQRVFGHSAGLRRIRPDATRPGALILWLGWPHRFRDRYQIRAPERCRKSRSACDLTNHGLGRGGFCNRPCLEALQISPSLGMTRMPWWFWTLVSLGIWLCLALGVIWLSSAVGIRIPRRRRFRRSRANPSETMQ